jgi:hypothetical protein
MPTPVTEAVRLAKEALGDAAPHDLAAYISTNFGMTVKPVIVSITLASFRDQEALRQSRRRAQELIAQMQSEPPAEKRKGKKPKAAPPEIAQANIASSPAVGSGDS